MYNIHKPFKEADNSSISGIGTFATIFMLLVVSVSNLTHSRILATRVTA